MLGAFHCPKCKTANACNCKNCLPHIKEGEPVVKWEGNREIMICANCGERFSLDEALETEFELLNVEQKVKECDTTEGDSSKEAG